MTNNWFTLIFNHEFLEQLWRRGESARLPVFLPPERPTFPTILKLNIYKDIDVELQKETVIKKKNICVVVLLL